MEGSQLTRDFPEPLTHRRVVKPQECSCGVCLYIHLAGLLDNL